MDFVYFLQDFNFGDADFEAAGGTLFGANFSGDDDAGLLREAFERGEGVGVFFQRDDALDDAGAVAKNREEEFAGFALIVEPALDGDFLRVVFAGVFNVDRRHGALWSVPFASWRVVRVL